MCLTGLIVRTRRRHLACPCRDQMIPFPEQIHAVHHILSPDLQIRILGFEPGGVDPQGIGPRDGHRITVLAAIIFSLAGSYDADGINRWFCRNRTQLGGRAPADILQGDWCIDSNGVRNVLGLAIALAGPGAPVIH